MSVNYRIILTGLVPDGAPEAEKISNLARLLKVPEERITKLLATAPVVIKKGVDRALCDKYRSVLTRAGATCEIEPEKLELSLEPTEEKVPEESPQLLCSQCGAEVAKPGKCESCVAANALARQQQVASEKLDKKARTKERLQQSFLQATLTWAKGNAWKAAILFVLLPVFGSGLILSTAFYTQDRHLIYQTLDPKTVCLERPDEYFGSVKQDERMLIHLFITEFDKAEREELMQQWDGIACRSRFSMEMGHVGDEIIPVTRVKFATWRFADGSKVPPVLVEVGVRNLSSSSPRAGDPVIRQSKGEVTIENLHPETLVTLSVSGWLAREHSEAGWERMMTGVDVDDGVVDAGNPSATAFARLLTIFF